MRPKSPLPPARTSCGSLGGAVTRGGSSPPFFSSSCGRARRWECLAAVGDAVPRDTRRTVPPAAPGTVRTRRATVAWSVPAGGCGASRAHALQHSTPLLQHSTVCCTELTARRYVPLALVVSGVIVLTTVLMIVLAPAPSYSPADLESSADRATTASNSEFGDGTAARFDGQSADGSTGELSLNIATPPSLNIAAPPSLYIAAQLA